MADELAPGEIGRRLTNLETNVTQLPEKIGLMLDRYVAKEVYDVQRQADLRAQADLEDEIRTLRKELDVTREQVATHRDGMSRFKGVLWILGAILGATVTVITSYIQSGRL